MRLLERSSPVVVDFSVTSHDDLFLSFWPSFAHTVPRLRCIELELYSIYGTSASMSFMMLLESYLVRVPAACLRRPY